MHEVQPTSETVATERVPSFRERSMSQTSSSQIGRPFMVTESRQDTVYSDSVSLAVTKQEHASESTHVQPMKEVKASEMITHFKHEKLEKKELARSVHVSPSRAPTIRTDAAVISKSTSLPVTKKDLASESTHIQPLREVKASEIVTQFKREKPEEKGLARSVHVSPSRAPTIRTEAAASEMACDLNVEQPKKMKQSGSVHISAVGIASVNQAHIIGIHFSCFS